MKATSNRNTNLFAEVHDRVTALEAAEFYGLEFGRNKRAVCPWHADKHPDLAFYDDGARCYCHACHEGGDAIALTAKLFGLSTLDAARKLNDDFKLGIDAGARPSPKVAQRKLKSIQRRETERWATKQYCKLCDIEQSTQQYFDGLNVGAALAEADEDKRIEMLDKYWDNPKFNAAIQAHARAADRANTLFYADSDTLELIRRESEGTRDEE